MFFPESFFSESITPGSQRNIHSTTLAIAVKIKKTFKTLYIFINLAMDCYPIVWVVCEISYHVVHKSNKQGKWWRLMIDPTILNHWKFRIICVNFCYNRVLIGRERAPIFSQLSSDRLLKILAVFIKNKSFS